MKCSNDLIQFVKCLQIERLETALSVRPVGIQKANTRSTSYRQIREREKFTLWRTFAQS